MAVTGTNYTTVGSLAFATGSLSLDRTRSCLWLIDATGGVLAEGTRQFSLTAPFVEQAEYVFDIASNSATNVGEHSGYLYVPENGGDDLSLVNPTTGVTVDGPIDGTATEQIVSESLASDGTIYTLGAGKVFNRIDVWEVDTTLETLTFKDNADIGTVPGSHPVISAGPDPVSGAATWLVIVNSGSDLHFYEVSYDGVTLSSSNVFSLTTSNDTTYLGDDIDPLAEYLGFIDYARDQLIIMADTVSNGMSVFALDRADYTTINWQTTVGGDPVGANELMNYGSSEPGYAFPFVTTTGNDAVCTLLNLNDGSILDSGTYDTGVNMLASDWAFHWDELNNSLYFHTNSPATPMVHITFTEFTPIFITDASNALDFLASPTFAPVLRGSDVTAVVNDNATFLQGILDEFADLDGSEPLNVDIDLNGYEFTNLPAEGSNALEVNRKD